MATVDPRPRLARPAARAARAKLERLYIEHGERVQAICASILRDRHEAEDAAQQVFVSALRALRAGTVPRDAGAWLATIARHESWTRARREPPAALHEGIEDRAQQDPPTIVARRAELAETWQTIAGLPPSQRDALLLREVRGLGYDELADDLRVSRASVRSLLSRARHTLRLRLEKGAAALTGAQWLNMLPVSSIPRRTRRSPRRRERRRSASERRQSPAARWSARHSSTTSAYDRKRTGRRVPPAWAEQRTP